MLSIASIVMHASRLGIAIPAFSVPYLPMVKPVIQAVIDQDSFWLIRDDFKIARSRKLIAGA
jgi:hypothetical protein